MYCQEASATLISPAALRRDKLTIRYTPQTDSFTFLSPHGVPLLQHLDNKQCVWRLPFPIYLSPSFPKSSIVPCSNYSLPLDSPCHSKPAFSPLLSSEIDHIFKFPIYKFSFNWDVSHLTMDERKLLFWHRLFGHAGLRRIRKMAKLKLGFGLPEQLPKDNIKCQV